MANDNVNLEGFQRDRYFQRAWALLTKEEGWWKTVLLMILGCLVPIVGPLAVLGLTVEWSRQIAWGSNEGLKMGSLTIGGCIASGFRALLVNIVWGIAFGIVLTIAMAIPLIGILVGSVAALITSFAAVLVMVAVLRATIYQKFGAGMRFGNLKDMISHDPNGLARIWGIILIAGAVAGVVVSMLMIPMMFSMLPQLVRAISIADLGYLSDEDALYLATSLAGSLGSGVVVLAFVGGALESVISLISYAALGLWFRQFDVPRWGNDEDPLPAGVLDGPAVEYTASAPAQPVTTAVPEDAPVATPAPVADPAPAPVAVPVPAPVPAAAEDEAAVEDDAVEVTPVAVAPAPVPVPEPEAEAEPEPEAPAEDEKDAE